ncbi:MAG: 50S ribosomal protein L4 [Candidatus Levybacteria bacterium]|nr:50S ribosomal protein L4 [Candidatus Levybacteria bacterium]MBI2189997.1 50S ribosomal protein L4 [Candidatus Levybacteria bacterium]MBI2622586.1 50S ribosomal protein L4 [Candidatus Levybacteria bacterium]MBI3092980.1 50S ribosomal protein L4 [Candidatus Levybacteria bacterium]
MPIKKKSKIKNQKSKIEIKSKKAKVAKRNSLIVDVYDLKGKVVEKIELPKEVFGAKINNQLMAQAVRVYLANQRKGTVSTKTRGEVKGSTRKIYKQKGTGRARHGSIRAPIFVGGGVVFGPKPRDYSLNLPKKMKRAALTSALSEKLKAGEVKVVKGLEAISPKTKAMVSVLEKLGLNTKNKNILLILSETQDNIKRAARNIRGVEIDLVNQLNTYEVLRSKALLLMKQSIETIRKSAQG